MHEYAIDDPDDDGDVLDGFVSDDGEHTVIWETAEIGPGVEFEAWWCETHNKLYYAGCLKGAKEKWVE